MKTQTTWIASLLIAAVGQTGAFAQDICVDMNKVYPEKTIRLDEVASVRYIPLGTTDDVLFNGKIVHLSDEGIAGFNFSVTKASSFLIQRSLVPTFSTYWNFLSH